MTNTNEIVIDNWAGCVRVRTRIPEKGLVILTGPNGSGKTSALSALRCAAQGVGGGSLKQAIRTVKNVAPIGARVDAFGNRVIIGPDGKLVEGAKTAKTALPSIAELMGYGPDRMKRALALALGFDVSALDQVKTDSKFAPEKPEIMPLPEAEKIVFKALSAARISAKGTCPIDGADLSDLVKGISVKLCAELADPSSPFAQSYRDAIETLRVNENKRLKGATVVEVKEKAAETSGNWETKTGVAVRAEINTRLELASRSLGTTAIPRVNEEWTADLVFTDRTVPYKSLAGHGGASGGEGTLTSLAFALALKNTDTGPLFFDEDDIGAIDLERFARAMRGLASKRLVFVAHHVFTSASVLDHVFSSVPGTQVIDFKEGVGQ